MGTRKATTPIIVILGLACVCGDTEAARANDAPGLSVTLSSPRTAILQYEPLILDIGIGNPGVTKCEINEPGSLGHDFIVQITGPAGTTRQYTSRGGAWRERKPVVLEPGQTYTCRFVVHHGVFVSHRPRRHSMNYVFPQPGVYSVSVHYPPGKGTVGTLNVQVSEPMGRDKEALQLFRGRKQADFVERPTSQREVPEEFRRLAAEYPDTVYGRYARFYLAATVLQHRYDWQQARRTFAAELAGLDRVKAERRLFEKVFEKTAAEFADLAAAKPAFPLADQCLLYEAQCYTGSPANRKAEAVAVLEDLVKRFPKSPVAVKARKRLEKLGAKAPAPTTRPSSP